MAFRCDPGRLTPRATVTAVSLFFCFFPRKSRYGLRIRLIFVAAQEQ